MSEVATEEQPAGLTASLMPAIQAAPSSQGEIAIRPSEVASSLAARDRAASQTKSGALIPAASQGTGQSKAIVSAEVPAKGRARLDLSKLKALGEKFQKVAGGTGGSAKDGQPAHETATGGLGAALLNAAGTTFDAARSRTANGITNRDNVALHGMERGDRVIVVTMARQQRAEELRRAKELQGMSDRVRRAQLQRERAEAGRTARSNAGQSREPGATQTRSRTTAESMRAKTVDGGTLRSQRAPVQGHAQGIGIRSITDARRAIAAPGRTVEGQSRLIGVAARGAGPAVTGQARQMRLAQPMPARQQLRLALPQTVNHSPARSPAGTPGMGAQRSAGVAAAIGRSMGRQSF